MSPLPALAIAVGAALVAFAVTPIIRRFAWTHGIVDDPARKPERSVHTRPTPLLGGFAVAAGIGLALLAAIALGRGHAFPNIPPARAIGVAVGAVFLLVGGILDDRWNLPARFQVPFAVAAALSAVLGGVAVEFITNPVGGVLRFDAVRVPLPWLPDGLPLLGAGLTVLWLLATTYAAKLLDGLDGLVTGIGVLSGATLTALALRPPVYQGDTAVLAAALAGGCLGFLPWNWNPARIFLGEAGASGIGFFLGVLAVISGGKIATALLILGLPILDVVWVMLRRMVTERRSPFTTADRKHLHHRLLALGLSPRRAVLVLWGFTATFGVLAVFTHGVAKLLALSGVVVVMLVLAVTLGHRTQATETK